MSKKKNGTRGDHILLGRFLAAVDQLMHTGMDELQTAYDDDLGPMSPVEVLWCCEGKWKGNRVFSAHFAYPAQAAEDLLARVCNGGQCTSCNRTVIVGVKVEGLCSRMLTATDVDDESTYKYVKECT